LYSSCASSTWSFPSADVEDQLRAVDDPGGERILERALLHRVELVVDEEHLRVVVRVRGLQLLQLALAHITAWVGACPALDRLGDRLHACGASQLAQLAELVLGVGALRQHSEQQAALWLRADPELGLACRHRPKYGCCRSQGGNPQTRVPAARR
jgi:hypothetical protein